ncbi:MAG: hypothetical protein OXF41_02045 [bacterium]|nr:hypothetical protein [bacterium]
MDEAVAALLTVPTVLLGILLMVSAVEGADRSRQLHTLAHRGATAAAVAVPSDATPEEARAGVTAGSAAAIAASTLCTDVPTVAVDYYDRRAGEWIDPSDYEGNTDWAGSRPELGKVRVSVTCLPLPGPLPAMTSQVTRTSQKPLVARPPTVEKTLGPDPITDQLQEEQ